MNNGVEIPLIGYGTFKVEPSGPLPFTRPRAATPSKLTLPPLQSTMPILKEISVTILKGFLQFTVLLVGL